jgi:hypothetical protein
MAAPLLGDSWALFVASDATVPHCGDVARGRQHGDRDAGLMLICFYAHHD